MGQQGPTTITNLGNDPGCSRSINTVSFPTLLPQGNAGQQALSSPRCRWPSGYVNGLEDNILCTRWSLGGRVQKEQTLNTEKSRKTTVKSRKEKAYEMFDILGVR